MRRSRGLDTEDKQLPMMAVEVWMTADVLESTARPEVTPST
jgi:hypothetical protein